MVRTLPGMPARVPLDVDLEDKLLYGLTPTRLAYMVVALLAGFALWSSRWAPSPVRAMACCLVVGAGAAVAWGRWQGRAADDWLADIALFSIRSYRVRWNLGWLERAWGRPSRAVRASMGHEPIASAEPSAAPA
ncbi:PrgI family protein [bacterium]|nr:MAG: PrgI family protein [bacterium]